MHKAYLGLLIDNQISTAQIDRSNIKMNQIYIYIYILYIYVHISNIFIFWYWYFGCKFPSGRQLHPFGIQLTKLQMVGTHVLTLTDSNWEHVHVIEIFHAPPHRINKIQKYLVGGFSTHLKNSSQNGNLSQIGVNINMSTHQLDILHTFQP